MEQERLLDFDFEYDDAELSDNIPVELYVAVPTTTADTAGILPTFDPEPDGSTDAAVCHTLVDFVFAGDYKICTLDYETYYDAAYTLSKLSIAEYVRDKRFRITSRAESGNLSTAAILVAHNGAFDFLILNEHDGGIPSDAVLLCTRDMAKLLYTNDATFSPPSFSLRDLALYCGLGEKGHLELATDADSLREYNEQDVKLTESLFFYLLKRLCAVLPNRTLLDELLAIHATLSMMAKPKLHLDTSALENIIAESNQRKAADPYRGVGSKSKKKQALIAAGIPEEKLTTLNKNHLAALRLEYSTIPEAVQAIDDILGNQAKDEAPRATKWLAIGSPLPAPLRYLGAHTGRWSGDGGINLQNLPRTGIMRSTLVAPDGQSLVVADLAQIEARVLAWLAGHDELLEQFERGEDVYKQFASSIYDVPVADVTKLQRQVAKSAVLGLGYSMGAEKFERYCQAAGVHIGADEAQRIVALYRSVNAPIVAYWRAVENVFMKQVTAGEQDIIMYLPLTKRGIRYNAVQYNEEGDLVYLEPVRKLYKRLYGGILVENIVQALARDLLVQIMNEVAGATVEAFDAPAIFPSLTVHDELVYVVPEKHVWVYEELLNEIPPSIFSWLKMETQVLQRYGK